MRHTTKGKGANYKSIKYGAGLTKRGVKQYRKEHRGSKLMSAVTKPPSQIKPGSKDDKRRKSFCARTKNTFTGPRGKAARANWHCRN